MYSKKQRFAALLGIILLVLLYIVTLICAIFDFDGSGKLFMICLFATIAVPILIWLYVWMYGKLTNKKTFADFSNMDDETDSASDSAETVTVSKRKTRKKQNFFATDYGNIQFPFLVSLTN